MSGLSLHIGLNRVDPAHYDGWDGALNACEFDANDMETLAKSRGFEVSKLLTDEATADAITAVIEDAAGRLGPGDIFFVTYSGHGGQGLTRMPRRSRTVRTRPGWPSTGRSSTTSCTRYGESSGPACGSWCYLTAATVAR
jgi:Caspase domain